MLSILSGRILGYKANTTNVKIITQMESEESPNCYNMIIIITYKGLTCR